MPQQDDHEYIQRRQQVSEEKAQAATDPGVARIHKEFANRYAWRLEGLKPKAG